VDKTTFVARSSSLNTLIVTPENDLVACFGVVTNSNPLVGLAVLGRITLRGVAIDEEARSRLRHESARDALHTASFLLLVVRR
jgi:hypothetical protein